MKVAKAQIDHVPISVINVNLFQMLKVNVNPIYQTGAIPISFLSCSNIKKVTMV